MTKSLTYDSDEALLKALRNSEPAAFESLYHQYFRMVAKQAHDQGGGSNEVEDLFQEVLFILVRKVRDPEFQLSSKLSTFLFAIARNLLLKKAGKKPDLELDNSVLSKLEKEMDDPTDREIWEDQLNVVVGNLELMEDGCQTLLRMTFFEKRSHAEVAEELGYKESFVKVKKHRCLEYLRKAVKDHPLFRHLLK